jgi:hypothetical protein
MKILKDSSSLPNRIDEARGPTRAGPLLLLGLSGAGPLAPVRGRAAPDRPPGPRWSEKGVYCRSRLTCISATMSR